MIKLSEVRYFVDARNELELTISHNLDNLLFKSFSVLLLVPALTWQHTLPVQSGEHHFRA
jgi:hypothetical protein